jgi:hypothetical protein
LQLELQKNFMNVNDYFSISNLIADLLVEKTKTETDTAALELCLGKLSPAGRLVRALRKRRFSNRQSLLKALEIIRPTLDENEGALLISFGHLERHDAAGNFGAGVR